MGTSSRCVDISREYHPYLGPLLAGVYLQIIQKYPALWDSVYDRSWADAAVGGMRRLYWALEKRKLSLTLEAERPDAIVCTHAAPFSFLAQERRRGALPCLLAGVLTDYGVHGGWAQPDADLILAPSIESAAELARRGVPENKIRVSGIPIAVDFLNPIDKPRARRRLNIASNAFVALISGGSKGLAKYEKIIAAVLAAEPETTLISICGSNASAAAALSVRFKGDPRVIIRGELPADEVSLLMAASDIHIGKAGGISVAESLALGLPLIICDALPGQEKRNCDYLLKHGSGLHALNAADAAGLCSSLRRDGGLQKLQEKARALGRPNSGQDAVAAIAGLALEQREKRAERVNSLRNVPE